MNSTKRKANPNPRDDASAPSALFHLWLLPLYRKGWKKTLEVDDLYDPLKGDRSEALGDRLEANWDEEVQNCKSTANRPPSLLRSLAKTFYKELCLLAVLLVTEVTLTIVQSLFLGKLLSHFRPEPGVEREEAMLYAAGMLACSFVSLNVRNRYEFTAFHTGMRFRAACCSLLYRKSLRLSCGALGDMASGQVVNLLSNDVSRFELMLMFLHYMWMAPIVTAVITYLFWRDGGLPSLIGLAVMLLIALCQGYIGKLSSKFRRLIALRTDERVRLVNEVISGIQVIKMYAWEQPFVSLMRLARRLELFQMRKTSAVRGTYMTFLMCTTRVSLLVSVVALFLSGAVISSDKVFVFYYYYNILSMILVGMFVRGCAEVSESYTCVKRIRNYLLKDEFRAEPILNGSAAPRPATVKAKETEGEDKEESKALLGLPVDGVAVDGVVKGPLGAEGKHEPVLALEHVQARWNPESDSPEHTLDDISVRVGRGQLLAVIGPVGAGKSSILQAILGELKVSKGAVRVSGKVSYASQDAWVFAATVRQNILFGSPLDKKRYDKVVKVCALLKDFEQFPQGDLTVVGERGVSLSGGQRARINLARAVYREADIYLLDDPLSAVDTHVGHHLFEECIRGYLKTKSVVLVTHQLQFLKNADLIVLMQHGHSLAVGTFQEILSSGIDYAKLLEEDEEEEETATSNQDEVDPLSIVTHRSVSRERKRSNLSSHTSSQQSIDSKDFEDEEQPQAASPLVDTLEASSKGTVKGSVFLQYFRASGSLILFLMVVLFFFGTQIAASSTDYWVAYLTKIEDNHLYKERGDSNITHQDKRSLNTDKDFQNSTSLFAAISNDSLSTDICVYIYCGIVLLLLLLSILRSTLYYYMVLRISQRLHDSMFCAVIKAPMRFFNTNPSGRILNRFSKDMGSLDELLPKIMLDASQIILNLTGSFSLTIITNYFLILPFFGILMVFRMIQKFYLKTSKNIKRLEGIVRSPVFSHMNVSLQGIVTIRAFGAERVLKEEFDKHQDLHSAAWYLQLTGSMAFSLALELTALCYNIAVFISIFAMTNESSGGEVGLALTQCIMLTGMLQWGIRQSTEWANNMMSAERVLEYVQLPPEQAEIKDCTPIKGWPQKGSIKLEHVYLRYSSEESPVLQDLNFVIQAGEKIGIVGRTGAGKSSLIATLYRMAVVEGHILIDDVDTHDIPLTQLRSSISIIPQDPVLFSGTMRYNLDPFNEYSDDILWKALEEVELKGVLSEQQGLNTRIQERGGNFSVGQRQLVCLARAIIRANRILMMDEATANVDPQTDKLIQTTIREKFRACTVLTVAHRLNTVIDSDRVLVMECGSVMELDHPWKLLEKPGGVFRKMVEQLEGHGAEQLRHAAKQHYELRQSSQH